MNKAQRSADLPVMRYPSQRYGNPVELQHYTRGIPLRELAKSLRRDERTVRDWLSGAQKVPFWVPELMRLRDLEHWFVTSQMVPPQTLMSHRAADVTSDGIATTPETTTAPSGAVVELKAA